MTERLRQIYRVATHGAKFKCTVRLHRKSKAIIRYVYSIILDSFLDVTNELKKEDPVGFDQF